MRSILLATVLLLPAIARAEEAPSPATGLPVETVKVTDQDPGLFERVRDAHLRAEKKGRIALLTAPAR
jgi:hypothetical protein